MTIRKVEVSDAKSLLNYFEELVKQDPERVERISDVKKFELAEEATWIKARMNEEETKDGFILCCEEEGKIVAVGEIERKKRWIERHVAEVRFGVLRGHEDKALELIKSLINIAKENRIEVLYYYHLATQKTGINIMKKAKFSKSGVIKRYYKRRNHYVDRIYLTRLLFPRD